MKICVLANALSVHTQRWARAYAERGHDVQVLSIRKTDLPGIPVHTVCLGPTNSTSRVWTFLSYLWLLLNARRRLHELAPDVVHAHYTVTHGVIAAFSGYTPVLLSAWGKDVIWDGHGEMPWHLRILNRYALSRADRVSSTSRFMIQHILHLGADKSKVRHIPFGCDTNKFRPIDRTADRRETVTINVGFIKRLRPKYGPEYLIKAIPKVLACTPNVRLVMAGSGPLLDDLRALCSVLKITDYVEFLGSIPHKEVPGLMSELDVLVNCSICSSESFGVVILEASACELPVIVTNVGGVPEVCLDGVTGFLIAPKDESQLADAISRLVRSSELRRRLGQAGRQFVQENYEWAKNVETMIKELEGVKRGNVTNRDRFCSETLTR